MADPVLYVLRDPRTSAIRYAGKTSMSLAQRLRDHIASARKAAPETRNHRINWIREVLDAGHRPVIEFVQETTRDDWPADERTLIARLRAEGHALVNGDDGGWPTAAAVTPTASARRWATINAKRMREDGTLAPFFSPETLEAMRERETGKTLSAETKAKLSAALKGRRRDPAAVEASASKLRGRPQSPELIAKRVAGRKANGEWFPNGINKRAKGAS
jgi:hypothetical protein